MGWACVVTLGAEMASLQGAVEKTGSRDLCFCLDRVYVVYSSLLGLCSVICTPGGLLFFFQEALRTSEYGVRIRLRKFKVL